MKPAVFNQELFNQSLFQSCWPWAVVVMVAFVALRLTLALSGAKLQLARIRSINRCEEGSVQSLSFVLTLPFFLMMVMLIVQASQIMIANMVVHYAAFASVRSSIVWIPANVSNLESANRISSFSEIQGAGDGVRYRINPLGDKYQKIRQAAVVALTPLGPSRSLGYPLSNFDAQTASSLTTLYKALDQQASESNLITRRLRNKVAYVARNTDVDVTFYHRFGNNPIIKEPPLQNEFVYEFNELGWQDHITSTVTFRIPLLPGPARLLAPFVTAGVGSATDPSGEVYVWPVAASATMGIEGDKALLSFFQEEFR